MKSSRYNTFFHLPPENEILLGFNSLTNSLVEFFAEGVPITQYIIKNPNYIPRDEMEKEAKEILTRCGFLIEDNVDELAFLEGSYSSSEVATDPIRLTCIPTFSCNLRCKYCYQDHTNHKMSIEVQDALIKMVEREARDKKNISLTWFGGEPLLAMDVMENLSKRFRSLIKENGKYNASLVSNGYLLNREKAKLLKDLGVSRVQITLDGPREVHNSRRPSINGAGTYDTILNNIKEISDIIKIDIRVNVDKNNKESALKVLDELKKAELNNKVWVYFSYVRAFRNVCADAVSNCLSSKEFAEMEPFLYLQMWNRGFNVGVGLPRRRVGYCTVDSPLPNVITPDGSLYKCWAELDDPGAKPSGNLTLNQSNGQNNSVEFNPFRKKYCRKCKILPICQGGCRMERGGDGKLKGSCVTWKYNLKKMIYLYYLQEKERLELEEAS